MAVREAPLHRQLREIAEGKQAMPTRAAGRRHWVPAFALEPFATPPERDGSFYELDTKSGKPSRTTPESTTLQPGGHDAGRPTPDVALAAFLTAIEAHGEDAARAFLADPFRLTEEDRLTLSYFLALQYLRTPAALTHTMAASQALMELLFALEFADEGEFRRTYRDAVDAKAGDDEIDGLRRRMEGELELDDLEGQAFRLVLKAADDVAVTIASMEWHVMQATEDEFITSDRPMALHDPAPAFPWSGHALASSPKAETTFPLSPEHMLFLFEGRPRVGRVKVGAEDVRELNLRTYSWAEHHVYGRTQEVVERVRRQSKGYRHLVTTPRKPVQVVLKEADSSDPTVGEEHAKKGWPRGLMSQDAGGTERYCAYTLVPPDDPASMKAAIDAELARRAERS